MGVRDALAPARAPIAMGSSVQSMRRRMLRIFRMHSSLPRTRIGASCPEFLHFRGSIPIQGEAETGGDATSRAGLAGPSQKIQKSSESLLTVRRGPDYIRLTNDGGDAAGDQEVRF
jgi:hypothetical protein